MAVTSGRACVGNPARKRTGREVTRGDVSEAAVVRVSELSGQVAINPSDFITFELSGTRNEGTLPTGEILQEVLGARVRVNFSPDLQLSSLGQYERASDEFE